MLILVFAMIFLSAIFVLAEFSFLRVRMSRIDQLIEHGNKKAISLKKNILDLDEILSTCQIGITVTSLVLGSLGEPAIAHYFEPIFSALGLSDVYLHTFSLVAALVTVTYLHVVLGEMFPKSVAIRYAESIALSLAKPMAIMHIILKPFVVLMNGTSNILIRIFGLKTSISHSEVHSQEELEHIIEESRDHGEIETSELDIVKNVFTSNDLTAREIMTPRVDVATVDLDMTNEEILHLIAEEKFTRFPITENQDKDKILGFFNTKDFLLSRAFNESKHLKDFMRETLYVHESVKIIELMEMMQKESIHFAIVLDEYGGTSGIITLEDILEELVGDIRDEYDFDEKNSIVEINDSTLIVDGKVLISEVNKLLDLDLSNDSIDTIGGLIFQNNQTAQVGTSITIDNVMLTLLEIEDTRYKRIKIEKLDLSEVEESQQEDVEK